MTSQKKTNAAKAFERLSAVLTLLHTHPSGLRIDYLAEQAGVPEQKLRDELLAYYAADTLTVRPDTIEFVTADGKDDDPHSAEIVQVVSDRPTAEIGVELMTAADWVRTYETAAWISGMDPGNTDLAQAVAIIEDRILSGTPPRPDSEIGATVSAAVSTQLYLDIEYSRAWRPGIVTRHIAPLRLVQTSHGWELDALSEGELRTFLIDRIRAATATTEEFEVPPEIDARLAQHRAITVVQLSVPQGWQWVVDRYAQHSTVLRQDEDDALVEAQFLPPLAERIGLILVTAPGSFVITPDDFEDAGAEMARTLLAHHRLQT